MIKLRPYQDEAADFLYEHDRAMILAPVGAGKTAITLTAMRDMIKNRVARGFLVLAPKRVCTDVWPVEAPKWAPELRVAVAIGSPAQRAKAFHPNNQVVVINYDNIQWLTDQDLSSFDGIVFDELTRLKDPSGKRFKALHKVINQFSVRWGLTGSFTSNGLEDVFGQCKIVDEKLLGRSKGAFMQQYFVCINREYGDWSPRRGALEMVMQKIKPATYLLDAGVYKDKLPPCHVVEVRSQMDRTLYEKMKRDFVVEFGTAQAIAANAAVVTGKLQQMASGFVYETTKDIDPLSPGKFVLSKTPHWFSSHKFDRLDELLDENQHANTIIAYTYQEELAELQRRYPQGHTLDTPNAVERWNAGKIQLLFVHPKSAGHGLNLQHGGCHIVFLSLPWSLELYEQTVGRLHRSGQAHAVWCYIMLTDKTVDERIWAALHDKRAISDIALEELK
jgi:SNF2 family DNA or RNA helicase